MDTMGSEFDAFPIKKINEVALVKFFAESPHISVLLFPMELYL